MTLQLRALGRAAELAPGDEELLFGAQAVDHRHRETLHRSLEGPIRQAYAGEIAERLAQHLLSLVVHAGLDRAAVVLIDRALAELLERVAIGLRSPVPRLPRRIEVGAQGGVERVCEIVRDPGAVLLRAVIARNALRSPVVEDLIDALRGSPRRGLLLTAGVEAGGDQPRARPPSR